MISHNEILKQKAKKRKSRSMSIKRTNKYSLKLFEEPDSPTGDLIRESFSWAFFCKRMFYRKKILDFLSKIVSDKISNLFSEQKMS